MNVAFWCQLVILTFCVFHFLRGLIKYFGSISFVANTKDYKMASTTHKGVAILCGLLTFLTIWFVYFWVFYNAGLFSELL